MVKKKKGTRDYKKNLILLFGVVGLLLPALIGAEMVTRAYWIYRIGKENFQLRWMQLAGATGVFPTKSGVINSLGFHSREIPVEKDMNTYRALVLGGSAVYGFEEIESSWAWYLEKRLKERMPGKNVEVLNAGIPGGTSSESADLLRDMIYLKPDVVIWYGGWNDVYYSHYCKDEYKERYLNFSYRSTLKQSIKELNRWFEHHSYTFLVMKKSYARWRKGLRYKTKRMTHDTEEKYKVLNFNDRFKDGRESVKPGVVTVHCLRDYLYELQPAGVVSDNFSKVYEENLMKMHDVVVRYHIPFVAILQPNLAYSVSVKAVSEEARQILEKTSHQFYDDWLNASGRLYPVAQGVIKELRGKKILAYDFTPLFEGENALFFTDSVHIKDPKALDIIAREVEEILADNHLLPEETQVDTPKRA